jgi:hypothetical protein
VQKKKRFSFIFVYLKLGVFQKKMLYVLSDHVALFMEKFEYDEANTTRHGELLKKNTFWSKIKFIREKFHDRYHAVATEQQTQTPQVT